MLVYMQNVNRGLHAQVIEEEQQVGCSMIYTDEFKSPV